MATSSSDSTVSDTYYLDSSTSSTASSSDVGVLSAADTTSPTLTTSSSTTTSSNAASTNASSSGVNDMSDISKGVASVDLPTRAEKRLIPTKVSASSLSTLNTTASSNTTAFSVLDTDFYISPGTVAKTMGRLTQYIKICIPNRGVNTTTTLPDPTQSVSFQFLVNPNTISVNRQTVDAQSLTRGGWQFGVWGEDAFMVQLSGQSAGSYFSRGLTDEYSYYAESYRNLMQLQMLFENNGYWFEGEEFNEGPLAPDYMRRRIRLHQDVQLWVGNYIWFGMFDSLSISQEAEQPHLLNFQLSFFAWKERFRSTSPYWGSITNNIERGHSYVNVIGQNSSATTTDSTFASAAVSSQVSSQADTVASTATTTTASTTASTTTSTSSSSTSVTTAKAEKGTSTGVQNSRRRMGVSVSTTATSSTDSSTSTTTTTVTTTTTTSPYAASPAVQSSAGEAAAPTTADVGYLGVQTMSDTMNSNASYFLNVQN